MTEHDASRPEELSRGFAEKLKKIGEMFPKIKSLSTDPESVLADIKKLAEDFNDLFNIVDQFPDDVDKNRSKTILKFFRDTLKKQEAANPNIPQLLNYFNAYLALLRAKSRFNDDSEIQSEVLSTSLEKMNQAKDELMRAGGWDAIDAHYKEVQEEIEDLINNKFTFYEDPSSPDARRSVRTNEEVRERYEASTNEGMVFSTIAELAGKIIDWDVLENLSTDEGKSLTNPSGEKIEMILAGMTVSELRVFIKDLVNRVDWGESNRNREMPLTTEQEETLQVLLRDINNEIKLYSGKNFSKIRQELEDLQEVGYRILHEARVVEAGARDDREFRKYLRPSTKYIEGSVYGEMLVFLSNYRDEISRAEAIGLVITQTEKTGGDASDGIADEDRKFLADFKEKLLRDRVAYLMLIDTDEGVISDYEKGRVEKLSAEIGKYVDWLDELIEAVGVVDKKMVEGSEKLDKTDLFDVLKSLLSMAASEKVIVTVHRDLGNWIPAMQEAYKRYAELKGSFGETIELEFADSMLGLWDYMYNTMDGRDGSVKHRYEDDYIDNYINPNAIRNIAGYYDLKEFLYVMRDEGVRMILGAPGGKDNKHEYDNNFIANISSFRDDLVNATLSRMGYADRDAFMADRPEIPNATAAELIFDFCYQLNMVFSLVDSAYAVKAREGGSPAHTMISIKTGQDRSLALPYATDIMAAVGYDIINPGKMKPEVMLVGLLSESFIRRAYKYAKEPIGEAYAPEPVRNMRYLTELYFKALVGEEDAKKFIGIIDIPDNQPLDGEMVTGPRIMHDMLEAVLDGNLSKMSRWFKVEVTGFATMMQLLFAPFKNQMDVAAAKTLYDDFVKQGPGKAKLAGEALPMDTMLAFVKVYLRRLFGALQYPGDAQFFTEKGTGTAAFKDKIFLAGKKEVDFINRLRAALVEEIVRGGQSTLSFITSAEDKLKYRAGVLEILGVKNPEEVLRRKSISPEDYGPIPEYLTKVVRFEDIMKYARTVMDQVGKMAKARLSGRFKLKIAVARIGLSEKTALKYLRPPTEILEMFIDNPSGEEK